MTITCRGSKNFRGRLILATLSGKSVKIEDIRSMDDNPGLRGTSLVYQPGIIRGGQVEHECNLNRAIGYYLQPMLCLAPFSKFIFKLTLLGITNDNIDISVDVIRSTSLKVLKLFKIEDGVEFKILKRGGMPDGGGSIYFSCPLVSNLNSVQLLDAGRIRRIRGIASTFKVSPQLSNRCVQSARSVLNTFIPDIYIYTDAYKGAEAGASPGFSLCLYAESTVENVVYSADAAFTKSDESSATSSQNLSSTLSSTMNLTEMNSALVKERKLNFRDPEDLAANCAKMLLSQIQNGGCVDEAHQWMALLFMALGPEDVSKIKLGKITLFSAQFIADLHLFFGVVFKERIDRDSGCMILSCVGSGYQNYNRRAQ